MGLRVEWMGRHSWTCKTTFDGPSSSSNKYSYLPFKGLYNFAIVRFNDVAILESDRMFLIHRIDRNASLNPSTVNATVPRMAGPWRHIWLEVLLALYLQIIAFWKTCSRYLVLSIVEGLSDIIVKLSNSKFEVST